MSKLQSILTSLEITIQSNGQVPIFSPIDGKKIAAINFHHTYEVDEKLTQLKKSFHEFRTVSAIKRAELLRLFAIELRQHKESLSQLVTIECGKVIGEARGEVQEMIDICDYAIGLARMIGGPNLPSERSEHLLQENWHPLGTVAIISAFNFPVAVWCWNSALATICGDTMIWKPSEKTPITAIAIHALFERVFKLWAREHHFQSDCVSQLVLGSADIGEYLVKHPYVHLVSATGSCAMGRKVKQAIACELGKQTLLELGGNNAIIVTEHADLKIALPSIVFGAVGTSGQRCTTTRRLFVHEKIFDKVFSSIQTAYASIVENNKIGNPLSETSLMGPLIDENACQIMQNALTHAREQGGEIYFGKRIAREGFYVEPALVKMQAQSPVVLEETFAPILYVMPYHDLGQAIDQVNLSSQGLSASIMSDSLKESMQFLRDVDTGIANVNVGTSGAEIGGAFGGNKDTGGGRESGSDSWKQYMRRSTNTLFYGKDAPELSQGVKFHI
jgi:aldehyde dehydrogenase (NAD+)